MGDPRAGEIVSSAESTQAPLRGRTGASATRMVEKPPINAHCAAIINITAKKQTNTAGRTHLRWTMTQVHGAACATESQLKIESSSMMVEEADIATGTFLKSSRDDIETKLRAQLEAMMLARFGLAANCSKECQRAHGKVDHKSFYIPKASRVPPPAVSTAKKNQM
jgi:hypothetical protein